MSKEQVYEQVNSFVNERVGKSKLYEIKFYVDNETAKDRSNFTQWVFNNDTSLKNKEINKVIDLCYGSGNLTSHILFESKINTANLILNDKNAQDRNNDIPIGIKTDNDFLNAELFNDRYDLIIFNPQVGGKDTYADGAVEFEKITPIIYDGAIEDYFREQGIESTVITVNVNEDKKSIFIRSETLSKAKMKSLFQEIKVFNYYDVFYQSKESKVEGQETNIVKFRKTLNKISKEDSIIIFLGEENIYNSLFLDYSQASIYLADEGKQLYILSKEKNEKKCYEYKDNDFIENEKCQKTQENEEEDLEIQKLVNELNSLNLNDNDKSSLLCSENYNSEQPKFSNVKHGNLDFPHKNLLLKGVPGTGKSHIIEEIINKDLKLKENPTNVCRINIHSASSNADLMQGIGINSNGGNIEYKEKQGLIYNHIKKALFSPNQPFVLVLEEIQENSLNELIGDLIYLIEEKKRVTVDTEKFEDGQEYEYQAFIEEILEDEDNKHYIEIPYLVDTSTSYRKMVLPSNLYIFCTSNYRDDKKVIEDNLLRRFDVVEIYPKYYNESWKNEKDKLVFKAKDVSEFLEWLNSKILEKFDSEIHPDRYLVGHANWLDITEDDTEKNKKLFYTALLKVIVEFKEIREVDFNTYTEEILKEVFTDSELSDRIKSYIEDCDFKYTSYKEMVEKLQKKIYGFLK